MDYREDGGRVLTAINGTGQDAPSEFSAVEVTANLLMGQMPAVIWATDTQFRFTFSEGGGLAATGTEPGAAVGKTLFEYFGTEDPKFPAIASHNLALAGYSATYEMEWAGRTFHSHLEPLRSLEGDVIGVVGFAIDVTELHEAEAKYRTLVEQLPAIVYLAGFGVDGEWLYVSPQLENVLGYTPEEWMADPNPLATYTHPDDRDDFLRMEEECQDTAKPFHCEYRLFAKDGREVWIRDEAVVVPHRSGPPKFWQGIMFDVTEQKRAEEELRGTIAALRKADGARRELLSRIVAAREEEHRRIASDVHDGPVQKMVAIGLRLEMLRRQLGDPEQIEALDDLSRTLEVTTRELRRLLFELVPPVLETEGLATALRALSQGLAEGTGIEVRLENRLTAEPDIQTRVSCFRIAREALQNVRKHSKATAAEVLLESSDGGVLGTVHDDGTGFCQEAVGGDHFGITGMRERAESAGGWLRVESGPDEGTTVRFWIPLPPRPAA